MRWDKWKLDPTTSEEIRECESVAGMRRRLRQYAYHNPIVKNVFDASQYRGLSGDDTMTWLAFEALRRVEKLEELLLDGAMTATPKPIIFPDDHNITRSMAVEPSSTPHLMIESKEKKWGG